MMNTRLRKIFSLTFIKTIKNIILWQIRRGKVHREVQRDIGNYR